jgi:hypothetical protein
MNDVMKFKDLIVQKIIDDSLRDAPEVCKIGRRREGAEIVRWEAPAALQALQMDADISARQAVHDGEVRSR